MLEMTGEQHPLLVTCLRISGTPSSKAVGHCEKWARKMQLLLSTTGGQAGPLAIPEITSFAFGLSWKLGGDDTGVPTLA